MHDPIVIMTYSTIVTHKEYSIALEEKKKKKEAGRKGKKIAKEQQPRKTLI
jgi:hypothetical protein